MNLLIRILKDSKTRLYNRTKINTADLKENRPSNLNNIYKYTPKLLLYKAL